MPTTAVVFIHGLFSGPKTWDAFRGLITTDPDLEDFTTFAFGYPSPVAEPDPRRRIPDYDAIADALALFFERDISDFRHIILVTHSQGGLIAQRYIAQMLQSGRGLELARISRVVMFSCPNEGADFFLGFRRNLWVWRHVQERQLRPLNEKVAEARRVVLERAVYATSISASTCPISFSVYAGLSDNVVKRGSAKGAFPAGGTLPGDHNSIISPDSYEHSSYRALKWDLTHSAKTQLVTEPSPVSQSAVSFGDRRTYSNLAEFPAQFLGCIANPDHGCDFGHPWCRPLSDNTIPLSYYVVPRARTYSGSADTEPVSLDSLFDQWLYGSRRNLLLLGEYGAGKTSACLYLFRRLCIAYQQDPLLARLPVFISLDTFSRGHPDGGSLVGLIDYALGISRIHGIEVDRDTLARRSIYILDGLDEMSPSATVAGIRSNLALLKPFFGSRSRVLISCRTHLFATATDLETAITGTGLAGELLTDIRSTESYMISEIQALSPEEIRTIIGQFVIGENPVAIWEELGRYYDLQDLSRRPILLGLVLQSLPILRDIARSGRRIREVDLYKAYIRTWTLRELSNKRLLSDPDKKLRLAEEIAALMYRWGTSAIDKEGLAREIRRTYGDDIFSSVDFQLFDYDTRDASFLTCNLGGEYRFLHRSFYEYFAACAFIEAAAREDHASTWRARWLTQEIATFAAQLLTESGSESQLRAVFDMALNTSDPTELWNALHLISLLGNEDLRDADIAIIASDIVPRGIEDNRSVLVRQYARVAAKFVSYEAGELLIKRVLEIVSASENEQIDNNYTYINYYGGADAACAAFLNHMSAPTRKYDRQLHIHVLGQLGSPAHVPGLRELMSEWTSVEDLEAGEASIQLILTRARDGPMAT